jgi:hypothetical protein
MSDRPGQDEHESGPLVTALSTSVRGNSPAFGYSIMITICFGALQRLTHSPSIAELLCYGLGAALAVALLEGAISRGFMRRVGTAPPEVAMLATAQNMLSVAAGLGAAVLTGELVSGFAAWPVGGFVASGAYVLAEAAETLLAELIQRARGDREAEREQGG